MLKLIPPGRSLRFYVLLSWIVPTVLGIVASLAVFAIVSVYSYRSGIAQIQSELSGKSQVIARRLSAEILIGPRGSVDSVSKVLQQEMGLQSICLSTQAPSCLASSTQEICTLKDKGKIVAYAKVPYVKDTYFAVASMAAPQIGGAIQFENLLWSALPIFLILSLGLFFQRAVLKSFFLNPIQKLVETSTGELEPRNHWPEEIREISEKLYQSFEKRDTEVFSKIARGVFHDLRTLIHTPMCATELVKEQLPKSDKRISRLEHLFEVSSHQLPKVKAIIDNTLDGSREIEINPIEAKLSATVESAISNLSFLADQHNAKLTFEGLDDESFVHDPLQLERALTNIIKNGIEATSTNSESKNHQVFVTLRADKNRAVLEIEDSGPGMPTSSKKTFRIMKSSKPNGSGLGLLVSKKIIEAHGGNISVETSDSSEGREVHHIDSKFGGVIMIERLPRVLAIDDDPLWLGQIPIILEDICEVVSSQTIDAGLSALENHFFDLVLLDLTFDGDTRTGLDVFKRIAAIDNFTEVIVISGVTRPDRLIQIMNAGVTQFIPKPSTPDEIRSAVRSVLQKRDNRLKAQELASQPDRTAPLIGRSQSMLGLREQIDEAVSSEIKDILLIGETGSGKEVVAKNIAFKADAARRFVPIHCGAISDGIAESELFGHVKGAFTGADKDRASAFEVAGGGFVFLDEIGEMPLHQQAKLLRVLQERKVQRVGSVEERSVSFKCISATHVDLQKAIADRRFREDLFYRIAKIVIRIPTLRERIEDIPDLIYYFTSTHEYKTAQFTDEAIALLQCYHWPGNVRQLQAAVDLMIARSKGGMIREVDVCRTIPEIGARAPTIKITTLLGKDGTAMIASEKKRFQKALIDARGDRTKAAQLLKISRATFFRRAKELGLVSSRRTSL